MFNNFFKSKIVPLMR